MIGDNDIELGLFQKAQSLDFIAENIIKVASSLQSEWEASVFVYGWGRVIPVIPSEPDGPIYRWNAFQRKRGEDKQTFIS